jgi:hypothetical protein
MYFATVLTSIAIRHTFADSFYESSYISKMIVNQLSVIVVALCSAANAAARRARAAARARCPVAARLAGDRIYS